MVRGSRLCILLFFLSSLAAVRALEFRIDEQFQPPLVEPTNALVYVATTTGGEIILTGGFTNVNGVPRSGIARLSKTGQLDLTWEAPGVAGPAGDAIVLRNGQILVPVGLSDQRVELVRLNADGGNDTTFRAPITTSFYQPPGIARLYEIEDGRLLFRFLDFTASLRILALNADGVEDTTYVPDFFPGIGKYGDEFGSLVLATAGERSVWFERYFEDGKLDMNYRTALVRHGVEAWTPDLSGGYYVGSKMGGASAPIFSHLTADGAVTPISTSVTGNFKTVYDVTGQRPQSLLISGFINASTVIRATAHIPDSPSILSHPVEGIARHGDSLRISAHVSGEDLHYQWHHQETALASQTNRDLHIPRVTVAQTGVYHLVVTNHRGASSSSPIPVQVAMFLPGDHDPTFNPLVPGEVTAVGIQLDGKIIAGGDGFVRRFMPDGANDTSFAAPAIAEAPNVILVDSRSGLIYVGGTGGAVRLNSNGAVDASFSPEVTGIRDLIVDREGRVLVAGQLRIAGQNGSIARLAANGLLDGNFLFAAGDASKILELSSGKLLVGGDFDHFNGFASRSLIVLKSSNWHVDHSFLSQMPFRLSPRALAEDANGSRIVAGFITYNDRASGLFKLLPNGAQDPAFEPPIEAASAFDFARQKNGKLVTLGERVLRLNPDGTEDRTFAQSRGSWNAIEIEPSEDVILGGHPPRALTRIFVEDRGTRLAPIAKRVRPYSTEILTIPGAEYALRYAPTFGDDWIIVDRTVGDGARVRLQDSTNRVGDEIYYDLQITLPQ